MTADIRILVVDDSFAERELIREAAHEFGAGVSVMTVDTPDAAELAITSFNPDFVLIDLHLGRWNGRQLLPRLTGRSGNVILSTAQDQQESALCLAAGALGFWVKPLRFDAYAEFFSRIRQLPRVK